MSGRVIKAVDAAEVYLIIDGKKSWISSEDAFNNFFDDWGIVTEVESVDDYETGPTLDQYSILLKSDESEDVYLGFAGNKRLINADLFNEFQFSREKVQTVSAENLDLIPDGGDLI